MPRKGYGDTVRTDAESLYVEDGLSYDDIADELHVSANTIKRWGADGGWVERRNEFVRRRRTLKAKLLELRETMMSKAIGSTEAQDAHAVIHLEKLALVQEGKADAGTLEIDRPKVFLEDLEFIAETLKETDPEGLKVLAKSFTMLISRFKERHAKAA